MNEFIVIFSTINSRDEAKKIAGELVREKLAACVNITDGITSIYEWKNELCTENECLMIIKSRTSLFNAVKDKIKSMHPYEVPEIISIPVTDGLESYLSWVRDNTK